PKPSDIAPGVAMPDGMFVRKDDHWVVGAPNAPADVVNYQKDHARLVVRYMFMMTPDEQKRLLSASPAPPAAPAATPAAQPTPAAQKTGRNIGRSRRREELSHHRKAHRHHRLSVSRRIRLEVKSKDG